MTPTLPRLVVVWIDRSHVLIDQPNGDSFPAIFEGGWHTIGGSDDTAAFDDLEGLLGWLQEELS